MLETRFVGAPGDVDLASPGDLDAALATRFAIPSATWTWLRQVHGASVVRVTTPGEWSGTEADAAVTATPGCALAIRTADCAPVVLHAPDSGVLGVAHAGWRGLVAGVLEATLDAMQDLGATGPVIGQVGPHIRARCYEFGPDDLDLAAARLGPAVRSTTAWGTPALDVTAGIAAEAARLGIHLHDAPGCTACEPHRFFSHRARADTGRHATVAWLT